LEAGEPENHALGRSQGGFSTKIHLLTDVHGIPLALTLTPGQAHESKSLETLLQEVPLRLRKRPKALAGDKAYSSTNIRRFLRKRNISDIIPRRKDEKRHGRFHRTKYRRRNIVERVFGWLKEKRRIATRYEKQALNYLAFIKIAAIRLILEWV
jgi:transposase